MFRTTLFLIMILSHALLNAQTTSSQPKPPVVTTLPRSFAGISLGDSLEQTKQNLAASPWFTYQNDDLSLLLQPNESLIDTKGQGFIEKGFFHFYNEKLYAITLILDKSRIDYYTMFTTLTKKNGVPSFLDPQKRGWTDENVIVSLEKPVTIKFIDKKMQDDIRSRATTEKSLEGLNKQKFLELFR